jgi:hypothetical protein
LATNEKEPKRTEGALGNAPRTPSSFRASLIAADNDDNIDKVDNILVDYFVFCDKEVMRLM